MTTPEPAVTEALDAVPLTVQAPPASALPQPPVTSRPKASVASAPPAGGGGGGAVTVTDLVTVPVAPPLSVTVSRTVYVPAAA